MTMLKQTSESSVGFGSSTLRSSNFWELSGSLDQRPNIVLILMDNLGWGEPGVYGGCLPDRVPRPLYSSSSSGAVIGRFGSRNTSFDSGALITSNGRGGKLNWKNSPRSS